MSEKTIQVVNFVINNQMYGINIQEIQNIERMMQITKVPKTSKAVRGVLNLRGEIIPVVNVNHQLKFNEQASEVDESRRRIVIIEGDEDKTGVMVDEVREVLEIKVDEIEAVPSVGKGDNGTNLNHVSGIAKINNGEYIVSILNIKNVINELTEEMLIFAANMEFEKAAEMRDKIRELEKLI